MIQATISLLSRMEHDIDMVLATGRVWENMPRSNRLLSERADELLTVLHELERSAVGVGKDG